jgi:hypothetical protein
VLKLTQDVPLAVLPRAKEYVEGEEDTGQEGDDDQQGPSDGTGVSPDTSVSLDHEYKPFEDGGRYGTE